MAKIKYVYYFGDGKAEGDAKLKETLGGKGANLAEMTNLGVPVPPGFTVSTDVCEAYYNNKRKYPAELEAEVTAHLARLEKSMGKKLGDPEDPLLVSVRSGAVQSMPGMMDTILNLGLNDKAVEGLAAKTGNLRFAYDSYRRFIQMYGDVVLEVEHDEFENALSAAKKAKNTDLDTALDAEDLKKLVETYKAIVKKHSKKDFPQNPKDQLWGAMGAVFGSWMNERAIKYRALNNIKNLKGTAVNIQSMVFGNWGEDSGTGVCFSRDPSTGKNEFYGEYLMNAQGEDVVAGIRTPEKISGLAKKNAAVYKELVSYKDKLEKHFRDMQDMEFTVQQGKLFILQTRNGKRTGAAAVKIAVDMVNEKLITKEEAILRVSADHIDQILHPAIDPKAAKNAKLLGKGLNASPGAACGQVVFTANDAENWAKEGKKIMLVRKETSPEDIGGMHVAEGILTSTGGMTSHAAVVARGMGTPCVSGAHSLSIVGKSASIGGVKFKEGDWMTIDGTSGAIYQGQLPLIESKISKELDTFLAWADVIREASARGTLKGFAVRSNADTPEDAKRSVAFGAQGIGLCRTEHMFFDKEKLIHFRATIVADSEAKRKEALKKILPLQKKDFIGIFKAMAGRPVTIRLLDPPLHEFVPNNKAETEELAKHIGVKVKDLMPKIDSLHETNPMLGHRGCRLAITYPEIYDTQVEAIMQAAIDCAKKKIPVAPEIMIPLICDPKELEVIETRARAIVNEYLSKSGVKINVLIGTMIEVPRAAILADKVANHADFFSYGTNDLTQMTYAFSRDDAGSYLPEYIEREILPFNPTESVDEEAVGFLMKHASDYGRKTKPELKLGICGEQGGDPDTIDFCYRIGLNYVSCSPFRVPIARLVGAQAAIKNSK